ncbi:hypothetical protein SLA2020_023450 [Shorea laevis]
MKKGKTRGFMCQSTTTSVACMAGDSRSVVMPRRVDRMFLDDTKLINSGKYSRLTDSKRSIRAVDKRGANVTASLAPVRRELDRRRQKPPTPIEQNPLPLPSTLGHVFQVVVMRVSLHCQGCAGKVEKHLSKMEGVSSFSIDLDSKRVTVMGHVSPVGVLESISKVKRAEFWPC